jgi:hypothetical protein
MPTPSHGHFIFQICRPLFLFVFPMIHVGKNIMEKMDKINKILMGLYAK